MRRVHRLAPQCDMLELVPPRRSQVFLEWQMRNKETTQLLNPKSKDRLHIWQKVNRDRDLNILEDYYWFYEEWDRINNKFVKLFNKTFPELLMERIHHYRIKMENAMLVAACIRTASEGEDDDPDQWMKSLRKYPWDPMASGTPKCEWDNGRTSSATLNDTKMEVSSTNHIGRADKDPPNFQYFKDQYSYVGKKQENWTIWEKFCFKMDAALKKLEAHYPDFTGLLVYGKRLKPPLNQPHPTSSICIEPSVQPKKPAAILGPAATISLNYYFILNQVGELSKRTVTLENCGETVLFYTWRQRPMESLTRSSKACLGIHKTNCHMFSVVNSSGSIQSNEVKKFDFTFKSHVPGVFLESWVICIAPKLPLCWSLDPVFFKGVAISEDHVDKLGERLSMRLYNHEMMSGINEIVMDILNQAARTSQAAEEMRNTRDYMFSNKALNFLQKNVDLEPPVFYAPTRYKRIEALAMVVKAWETCDPSQPRTKQAAAAPGALPSQTWGLPLIPWAWDGSFSSISTGIEQAAMSERMRQHFQSELQSLKELVQIPPDHSVLCQAAIYKMLKRASDHTGDVITQTSEEVGTRMVEGLIQNYSKKQDQGHPHPDAPAITTTAKQSRATKPESMGVSSRQIQSEKASSDAISLESRQDRQEMLEMCFKWLQICTEMRLYWEKGIDDYEEQLSNEQSHLKKLINQRILELIPFVDETSSWDRFALERAKQQLLQEEYNTK